jgi:hypothetical protein
MVDWQLKTPVVFLIFNRPDTTEKVFDAIRQAQPPKLLVVADGPRAHKIGEAEKCAATRAIIDRVDWDCEVFTNYSETNLGCERRVSSGLTWVFETVEEAIILEDDCLPEPSFFRFCEELLERYRHDERIMVISGQNVQFGRRRTAYSYYFSCYNHCWGWASWRRAWKYYDAEMKLWPQLRTEGFLKNILLDERAVKVWENVFQPTYEGSTNSWAYKWTFSSWLQNGLTILPDVNLISNIGHGAEGTHTTYQTSQYSNLPTEPVTFPLKHPPFMFRNLPADHFTQNTLYDYNPSLLKRIRIRVNKLLGQNSLIP